MWTRSLGPKEAWSWRWGMGCTTRRSASQGARVSITDFTFSANFIFLIHRNTATLSPFLLEWTWSRKSVPPEANSIPLTVSIQIAFHHSERLLLPGLSSMTRTSLHTVTWAWRLSHRVGFVRSRTLQEFDTLFAKEPSGGVRGLKYRFSPVLEDYNHFERPQLSAGNHCHTKTAQIDCGLPPANYVPSRVFYVHALSSLTRKSFS